MIEIGKSSGNVYADLENQDADAAHKMRPVPEQRLTVGRWQRPSRCKVDTH